MLFSNDEAAKTMNEHFECAWESVRAVPRVDIDFGDGRKLTRTLQGNVATYFCLADGRVVDIVPGLATPTEYIRRATEARELVKDERLVREHHRVRANVVALPLSVSRLDVSKMAIERPIKSALEEDSDYNLVVRMPKVHALLAEQALAQPSEIKAVLFRDILGYDIEDPYLGLAPLVLGGEMGRHE